jgi:AraC-like DNA-binding protein
MHKSKAGSPPTRSPLAAREREADMGTLRIGALVGVPELLRKFGIDAEGVLAEFDLEPAYFAETDNPIAFATMGHLLARCAAVTGCPHFGLLAGERSSASALGPVGFLLQSAPTVRAALAALSAHYRVHNPYAAINFEERNGYASMSYRILPAGIEGKEHILDGAMAIMFNLVRKLCGTTWLPAQVRLARRRPVDPAPYSKVFHSAPLFNERETALVFLGAWLNRVPPGCDPLLHKLMQRRVEDLEAADGEGIASRVRRLLPSLIASEDASQEQMSRRLGLLPRTLNRRLAAAGTTYAELRGQTLQTMACQLLETTQLPVMEISDALGYSNPAAFTRAFLRWTGVGPQEWRKAHRCPGESSNRRASADSLDSNRPAASPCREMESR